MNSNDQTNVGSQALFLTVVDEPSVALDKSANANKGLIINSYPPDNNSPLSQNQCASDLPNELGDSFDNLIENPSASLGGAIGGDQSDLTQILPENNDGIQFNLSDNERNAQGY